MVRMTLNINGQANIPNTRLLRSCLTVASKSSPVNDQGHPWLKDTSVVELDHTRGTENLASNIPHRLRNPHTVMAVATRGPNVTDMMHLKPLLGVDLHQLPQSLKTTLSLNPMCLVHLILNPPPKPRPLMTNIRIPRTRKSWGKRGRLKVCGAEIVEYGYRLTFLSFSFQGEHIDPRPAKQFKCKWNSWLRLEEGV